MSKNKHRKLIYSPPKIDRKAMDHRIKANFMETSYYISLFSLQSQTSLFVAVVVSIHFWRWFEAPLMLTPPTRKVMVIADPAPHSAAALQYALSHALLDEDELILLHVGSQNSWINTLGTFLKKPTVAQNLGPDFGSNDVNFLDQMKYACEIARPNIPVRTNKTDMDGKDKANVILSKSKDLGIDLLIIGQKRNLSSALIGYKMPGGSTKGSKLVDNTVDYLIENSQCACVAVQKKGQNGYVLNSKTLKNFWLLA